MADHAATGPAPVVIRLFTKAKHLPHIILFRSLLPAAVKGKLRKIFAKKAILQPVAGPTDAGPVATA